MNMNIFRGDCAMTEFSEFGSREYAGWSDGGVVDAYIKHFVPITDAVGSEIVARQIDADDDVLDLCCGQGTLTASMAKTAARVTGLDFSAEMIARARVTAPAATIVEGTATAMPFDDAQFDKVVCNFGMMHIADQPKALSEVRRVLKPDGTFTMATWMGPASSPAFAAVFGALKAHADFSAAPAQPDLFAFADPAQAGKMMASAQLEMGEHDRFDATWVLDEPGELFDIFLTATVGARMLIRSQTDETVEKISGTIAKTVSDKHFDGTRYTVPVPVALVSATAA
jgi:SAM-dependent methyltransferase